MLEVQFTPFPVLTTERLLLRQLTKEDADALFILRSDPQVMQYIDRPIAISVEDVFPLIEKISENIANNAGINWAITMQGENDLIGMISFHVIEKEHFRAELGYMLSPAHQRKGIMQEAIARVIRYGFENMGLHSIEAKVNPANQASINILEKNGFVREAYYRENYFWNGRFLDTGVYSLLANRN